MTNPKADPMREAIAKEIYDVMPYDSIGDKPKWIPDGNSFKQGEARRRADTALASQPAAAPDTVLEESQALDGTIMQTVRLSDGSEVVRPLSGVEEIVRNYIDAFESHERTMFSDSEVLTTLDAILTAVALSTPPVVAGASVMMDTVRQTIANEWGSHICFRDPITAESLCDKNDYCRCADIARAVIARHSFAPDHPVAVVAGADRAAIEVCARVADRAAKRCVREQTPGDGTARFIAAAIRGLVYARKVGE